MQRHENDLPESVTCTFLLAEVQCQASSDHPMGLVAWLEKNTHKVAIRSTKQQFQYEAFQIFVSFFPKLSSF